MDEQTCLFEAQNLIRLLFVNLGLPDVTYPEPENSRQEALQRVLKHRINLIRVNPADDQLFDEALRCALTHLMTGEVCIPPQGSDLALRYLRDRISVPRDVYLCRQAVAGSPGEYRCKG